MADEQTDNGQTNDEQPEDLQDRFDEALDDATHDVIARFEWMKNLPEGEELSSLMVRINDSLTNLMQEYK